MKYGNARNIYIAVVSLIGFSLFVNSLIHFDFSKTAETLILILYYFVAGRFEVFLFKKNCHYSIEAPIHLLSIIILGYQAIIPLAIAGLVLNYYHWKRNQVSFFQGVIFASLLFVPAIYFGNLIFSSMGGNGYFTLTSIPYKAIFNTVLFLLFYGFFIFQTLVAFPGNKRKVHFDFLFIDTIDYLLFPMAVMIDYFYNLYHALGLLLGLLPLFVLAYLFKLFLTRFFERDEMASVLAISTELIESGLDLQSMASRIAEKVRTIFEASSVEIFLKNKNFYEIEHCIGRSPWENAKPNQQFMLGIESILPKAPIMVCGSPIKQYFECYKKLGIEVLLIIPLTFREEYIGFILCSSDSIAFDLSHELFSKNLVPILSTALVSAQLHERLAAAMKELREAKEQILHFEKLASLGQLTAGIAHELNTPLSTLLIQVETLKEQFKQFPKSLHLQMMEETCSVFESQINRLANIIDGLRSFSKNEWNEETWSYLDLPQAVLAIIENDFQAFLGRIKIHVNFKERTELWCCPSQINQILRNVISNAFLAIGGEGDVWITGFRENDKLIVSIRDNGSGIPKKIRNRIFDPFFTTREIGEGKGLGLSIAYGIMERHSGEISFESEEGVGTTFYLIFPQTQSLFVKV